MKKKKLDKAATPLCMEVAQLRLEGNITPNSWYNFIKIGPVSDEEKEKQRAAYLARRNGAKEYTPRHREERADLAAICILADIMWCYKPREIRNENGRTVGWEKFFIGEYLKRSYSQFAKKFGITVEQARRACENLKRLGLITIEHESPRRNDGTFAGTDMIIKPVVEKIKEITFRVSCEETTEKDLKPARKTTEQDLQGNRVGFKTTPEAVLNPTRRNSEISDATVEETNDNGENGENHRVGFKTNRKILTTLLTTPLPNNTSRTTQEEGVCTRLEGPRAKNTKNAHTPISGVGAQSEKPAAGGDAQELATAPQSSSDSHAAIVLPKNGNGALPKFARGETNGGAVVSGHAPLEQKLNHGRPAQPFGHDGGTIVTPQKPALPSDDDFFPCDLPEEPEKPAGAEVADPMLPTDLAAVAKQNITIEHIARWYDNVAAKMFEQEKGYHPGALMRRADLMELFEHAKAVGLSQLTMRYRCYLRTDGLRKFYAEAGHQVRFFCADFAKFKPYEYNRPWFSNPESL